MAEKQLLPEATVIWPNGQLGKLLALYSPVLAEPPPTTPQKNLDNVFVISTHAHSEPFSYLSDGDRTKRIKWVLRHFLNFIIQKEKEK